VHVRPRTQRQARDKLRKRWLDDDAVLIFSLIPWTPPKQSRAVRAQPNTHTTNPNKATNNNNSNNNSNNNGNNSSNSNSKGKDNTTTHNNPRVSASAR